jgi:hypothetical protein
MNITAQNLKFESGQKRWNDFLGREMVWTFNVYIEGRGYEFELEYDEDGCYVSTVTQFAGEELELSENQVENILKEWES